MIRTISWVGALALALAALGAVSCGDDAFLDPPSLGGGGASGSGGAGGAGTATGGTGGASGSSAGSSAGGAGLGGTSAGADLTGAGVSAAGRGVSAAGAGAFDSPDAGDTDASVVPPVPVAVDAGAGSGPASDCAVAVITTLPYSEPWQTTNGTGADVVDLAGCQLCNNTDDHIVTFTAPAAASYRFFASSGGDVELAVYPGDCSAAPDAVSCGEDIDVSNGDYDDQVLVQLARGETVTVVVGESCEEEGGAGTLTIQVVP